jgi:CBS-domain-containing membrane protein
MALLRDMQLVSGSVRDDAGFPEAAQALLAAHSSAIAVVDHDLRVVGLFTDDDLLRGLFPPYLGELHHTAFLVNEGHALRASIEAAAGEPVTRYMREAVTVDIDAGAAHVVERFLHTPWGAIAVVEAGRFIGMVGQLEFTELLMEQLDIPSEWGEMG